ncbi:LysR family transcriptional regulator [Paenibacillus aurantius]|uniref:LysR family transcriptional regulator n=1 Tax=Paenibacillus aurantius TaxID=2918900 RepID=A0AA96LJ77_9BACL|nr:LysR family transcriptional regulator [Paenibacillus aurantius]WNQ14333.1 LysR family transcriptional regulator [Paenibacillus aurantius]
MLDNLEWYRAFYFTAKTGSLTKAAEELFITQPAVTHAIKQLEFKLGGQLFFRTPKGVKLTSEGEVLYRYIDQAFTFIQTGETKLAELRELKNGEVRIGAGDTLCKYYLLRYLEAFHKAYPSIRIQVTNRTSSETVSLLKQGKIDFGLINLPLEDKRLTVQESLPLQDCFVAGEKYKHLAAKSLPLQTLARYPLLLLEKGSGTRSYLDAFALEQGIELEPEIELGSIDLLTEFARTGFGIACVVRNFAEEELARGDLYEIRLTEPIPPRPIGIATLNNVPLSPAPARLVEMMLKDSGRR